MSLGLQGDPIQPLVLRVLPGECLRVRLTNELADEPASFHLHASSLVVTADGTPASAANPAALAAPGRVGRLRVGGSRRPSRKAPTSSTPTANARAQSGHGLFGTLVVEPAGSTWVDPRTGEAADADGTP